jgi:uncharacterized protein (DUF2252 family)
MAVLERTTPASGGLPSPEERTAEGKACRRRSPRSAHAAWEPRDSKQAVDILLAQAAGRVPELVPVRHGRMLESPFAFYRGGAAIMAADLAGTPQSGIRAQLCGDAHLANFGGFASPERDLVFDINDFDETARGPWEWDVKRLAASVEIAGRELGLDAEACRAAVRTTVRAYREAMRRFAEMGNLEVWYARIDAAQILAAVRASTKERKTLERRLESAQSKDHHRALSKLTENVDGEPRFVSRPPLIVPVEELIPGADGEAAQAEMLRLLRVYRRSLKSDRRHLLESYRFVHMARKVVGVGSVGTRAWVVLLAGRDGRDPLFMQVKEANESVLEPFVGRMRARNHGQRVVEGQWLMQASSDILLGWLRSRWTDDGVQRDFYVRQLWDWKVSVDFERMDPARLPDYGTLCGLTLARAHARSGDRVAIASYLGAADTFERALAEFAHAYADQNERDFAALAAAASEGRVAVERGV